MSAFGEEAAGEPYYAWAKKGTRWDEVVKAVSEAPSKLVLVPPEERWSCLHWIVFHVRH
jgi:hypothetical protein